MSQLEEEKHLTLVRIFDIYRFEEIKNAIKHFTVKYILHIGLLERDKGIISISNDDDDDGDDDGDDDDDNDEDNYASYG